MAEVISENKSIPLRGSVLLIGYCGLHGIWPRVGILLMAGINVCVFLLGLGHLTKLIW